MAGHVFATVGTTKFDDLIAELLSDRILELFRSNGFESITLQVGRGAEPILPPDPAISVNWCV